MKIVRTNLLAPPGLPLGRVLRGAWRALARGLRHTAVAIAILAWIATVVTLVGFGLMLSTNQPNGDSRSGSEGFSVASERR